MLASLSRLVATWPRRTLLALTLLSGLIPGALIGAAGSAVDYATVAVPVHSLMSAFLPFLAILVARDHRPHIGVLLTTAVAVGALGNIICAVVAGGWDIRIALGAVLVQVTTTLIGIGFARAIRSAGLAMLADLVLPLGLWALLGVVGWNTVRAWATPYAAATDLLTGLGGPLVWPRAVVATSIWVGVLALASRPSGDGPHCGLRHTGLPSM